MNDTKELELQTEIHVAEIDRSLALTAQVWESSAELSVNEMCEHLKAIGNVVDQTATFSEFVLETDLSGLIRLN